MPRLSARGKELGATVECFQTNSEGAMTERIIRAAAGTSIACVPLLNAP
jgi:3-dehydroquinate dehydratase